MTLSFNALQYFHSEKISRYLVRSGVMAFMILNSAFVGAQNAEVQAGQTNAVAASNDVSKQGTVTQQNAISQRVKLALGRMANVLRQSNYEGSFTYERSGALDLMKIRHAVIDGKQYEDLTHLNGPEQSIARSGRSSQCETVASQMLNALPSGLTKSVEENYLLQYLGEDRIAGYQASMIQVLPKDEYRHGMIVGLERETGFPLKLLTITRQRKVLERLHFTEIKMNVPLAVDDFKGVMPANMDDSLCESHSKVAASESSWRPSWVPPGFVLSAYRPSSGLGDIETYTDGIATFSLFIKPSSQAGIEGRLPAGATHVNQGATSVVLVNDTQRAMHFSLLGEIPNVAANKILASIEPASR